MQNGPVLVFEGLVTEKVFYIETHGLDHEGLRLGIKGQLEEDYRVRREGDFYSISIKLKGNVARWEKLQM